MALVYDRRLVAGVDRTGKIADAVAGVVAGDSQYAVASLDAIEDPALFDRGLHMVSAMWHEKRHFLDFILSNYGAFRFRQFLDVYVNLPLIIRKGKESGVIHAPLEIYNDPVRAGVLGIHNPSPELQQIAAALSRRRRMIERDRTPITSRLGSMELGGEALLESLAFLAQLDFVLINYGQDGAKRFYDSLFNKENFFSKYLGVVEATISVGLAPASYEGGVANVDSTLLECILFAALQSDYRPGLTGPHNTSYPGERFAGICVELAQARPDLKNARRGSLVWEECWHEVNAACIRLFGQDVLQEMELDFGHFKAQTKEKLIGNVPDDLEDVVDDYFNLREQMLKEFANEPQLFVTARRFTAELADRLQPNYVVCTSNGTVGDPPDGHDLLMGYADPEGDLDNRPYAKWWWACAPKPVSDEESENALKFGTRKSWYNIMDFYAPIAKLLMNGRRIRTLIGPELLYAQQRLSATLSIEVEFYPSFEYPQEELPADIFYYYYGSENLICDWSSAALTKPEGQMLSPWTLRRWPKLAQAAIEKMGGHEFAYFAFVRDWSPWIVSDTVYEKLKGLMVA
jgi:hypothetical protein